MAHRDANPDRRRETDQANAAAPFRAGALVVITLSAPREKFWGALLSLSGAGVSVRGINLDSFNDFATQLRDGDAVDPACVFFPMHRVERIDLDSRNGDVPSLAERFDLKTGHLAASIFLGEVSE